MQNGIRERFQPIFTKDVEDKWVFWLGDMIDNNPSHIPTEKKLSGTGVLSFVQSIKIDGFNGGLTPLQFANNLWAAGIVAHPPVIDMVIWL
jgi:hypothetical protein